MLHIIVLLSLFYKKRKLQFALANQNAEGHFKANAKCRIPSRFPETFLPTFKYDPDCNFFGRLSLAYHKLLTGGIQGQLTGARTRASIAANLRSE